MQTKLLEKNIYLNRGKLVIFEKRIYNELNFIYRLASFIKFKNYFLFKSLPNSVEWLGVICFPDFLPPKNTIFFINFFWEVFRIFFYW